MCFRSKLTIRGNNTNNIVEASIRIFKDIVLERRKAFNMIISIQFAIWSQVTTNKDFSMLNLKKKTNSYLAKIQTPAQLSTLFVNSGKRSTNKNISVQPTAIAHRIDRAGLTKE